MRVLIGRDELPCRRFTARLLWEPRDIWLGVFWNTTSGPPTESHSFAPRSRFVLVYVCLIPCLPLALVWRAA